MHQRLPRRPRRLVLHPAGLLGAGLALAAVPAACTSHAPIVPGPVYPGEMMREETLDIQVFRRTQTIELTNTTARRFGPGTLWLNARFARAIDGLDVGQTLVLPLAEFRDEFSERFRAGGFFATEKPYRLVLAELETEGRMRGLVVVGSTDE